MQEYSNFPSYTPTPAKVLMEELFQNLRKKTMSPPDAIRQASRAIYYEAYDRMHRAGELAEHHLAKEICRVLQLDIDEYDQFLIEAEGSYQKVRDAIAAYLEYTTPVLHDKQSNRRELAVKFLVKSMTEKLLSIHNARHPKHYLTYVSWSRVVNGEIAPTPATLEAIRLFLQLNKKQYTELFKLVQKNVLYHPERVADIVERNWNLWSERMKLEKESSLDWKSKKVFHDHTGVSRTALTALLPSSKESSPQTTATVRQKNTTQATMLKLAVAFRFRPATAENFLAKLDSGFYDMRDLLFCSCLYLDIFDPYEVHALLEFYARSGSGKARPRFDNPYLECFGEGAQSKK